jgi:hypothetical protein
MAEINRLDSAKKCALWDKLRECRDELDAAGATQDEAAATMTKLLGFEVTKSDIADAQEHKIAVWNSSRRVRQGDRNADRIGGLEAAQAALAAAQTALAADVATLAAKVALLGAVVEKLQGAGQKWG